MDRDLNLADCRVLIAIDRLKRVVVKENGKGEISEPDRLITLIDDIDIMRNLWTKKFKKE